ncbi:MAG: helix-turn-helix domain-containing protein [Thermoplasmata archaeon]
MKTISFEFKTEDLEAIGLIPHGFFSRYEEVELLETLRLERGWRLQLLRVRRRGPLRTAAELARESRRIRRLYGLESLELVERRPRTRDYIVLVRQRNPATIARLLTVAGGEITPIAPFRADPTRTVASFYGEDAALRKVVARLTREGMPFQVLRTSGRPYGGPAGSEELTDRQRRIVSRAWAMGYYAVPRRLSLTRLARLTGQSPPALSKMLRRAEGRLVARFLATSEAPRAVESDPVVDSGRPSPSRVS